ncbi:hypothetical protein MRB53_039225 [Persea americana]|nr:hypothetical protein MRB53_039225 [Persea americana]
MGPSDDSGHVVLDFSTANGDNSDVNLEEIHRQGTHMEKTSNGQVVIKELDALLQPEATPSKGAFSFFTSLVSGKTLTANDLDPVMENMRQHFTRQEHCE